MEKKSHSFTILQHDETNHWYKCVNCDATTGTQAHSGGTATCKDKAICEKCMTAYGALAAHNYIEKADAQYMASEATCISSAVYYKSCSVCGTKGTETFESGPVNKNNHVDDRYTSGQKEATCYEEGYTGDTYCSGCDTKLEKGTIISKGEHNPADVWTTDTTHHWKACQNVGCGNIIDKAEHCGGESTCTEQAVCEVCGVKYGELNANNHKNTTTINAKDPTCTETGYTGDTYCNDCKKTVANGTAIDPTGHTPSEWKSDENDHWKICTVEGCGTEIADSRAVHTESEWIVDKAATTAEDGSKHTECTVCGKVLNTESIPKLKEYAFDDSDKSWTQGSNNGLTLGMDADVDGITKVEIDGNTVAPENYTVNKENSTITFSAEFLKNQTVGKHNLTITLNDGVANTQFEIKSSQQHETSPQTGDNSHLALWISLMILSLCGLAATLVIPKRRRVK